MPPAAPARRPTVGNDAGTRVRCGTRAGRLRVGELPPRFYEWGKLADVRRCVNVGS